jgi:hypothetical protein
LITPRTHENEEGPFHSQRPSDAQLDAQLVLRKRLNIRSAGDLLWSIGLQFI